MLLENFINNPHDETNSENLLNFLENESLIEKQSYALALSLWNNNFDKARIKDIEFNIKAKNPIKTEDINHLSSLKAILEDYFTTQIEKPINYNLSIKELNRVIQILESFKKPDLSEKALNFVNILSYIAGALENKMIKNNPNDNLKWDEYAIYFLIENYIQFFEDSSIANNNLEALNTFINFYSKVVNKALIPIFLSSTEENIVVEPTAFPDKIHIKVLQLMNIENIDTKNLYITASLSNQFLDNSLFTALFAHEIGHLLDINHIDISSAIINDLLNYYPELLSRLDKDVLQWIREIIADAVAICLAGPAYLCAMVSFINDDRIMTASNLYPSIAFRVKILYTYLFQNEFISLLSPEAFTRLQNKLQYLQAHYNTSIPKYIEFEDIIQQSISAIYSIIAEFLHNAGVYSSYNELVELICSNNGSLVKTKDLLLEKEPNIKQVLNLQNINWLIELKKDTINLLN